MILKFIIFAAIGLFVYKMLGGELPGIGKKSKPLQEKETSGDTMVECSKCGTYVTIDESIRVNGKYYCDECA